MLKPFLETSFLCLLLGLFVIKEVLFALLLPVFQNPDEQVHYATIQYRAEPKEKNWPITWSKNTAALKAPIDQFHYSEEIIQSGKLLQFDELRHESRNTQNFSQGLIGLAENEIEQNNWKQYIDHYPVNISGTTSLYYWLGAKIENLFTESSFLIRFFNARFVSIFFGVIILIVGYLTIKKVFSSMITRLCLAFLVAFHPMLSVTAAQVNIDISLIFSFSLFLFASTSLIHHTSIEKKSRCNNYRLIAYGILSTFAAILGFYSKGPGIVLVISLCPLLAYGLQKYYCFNPKKYLLSLTVVSIIGIGGAVAIFPQYLASITAADSQSAFSSPVASISKYLSKTFDLGEFRETAISYWGHFGWLDTRIGETVFEIIWIVEIVGMIGLACFLIPWQRFSSFTKNDNVTKILEYLMHKRDFLLEKKYIVFLLAMALALQLAIRFFDWRVFDIYAKQLIGTPGRYFLPNVIGHIILLVTGLGYFCRTRLQFQWLLKSLVVGITILNSYIFLEVIIPRYYL